MLRDLALKCLSRGTEHIHSFSTKTRELLVLYVALHFLPSNSNAASRDARSASSCWKTSRCTTAASTARRRCWSGSTGGTTSTTSSGPRGGWAASRPAASATRCTRTGPPSRPSRATAPGSAARSMLRSDDRSWYSTRRVRERKLHDVQMTCGQVRGQFGQRNFVIANKYIAAVGK